MVLTMAAVAAAKEMPAHGFTVSVRLAPYIDNGSGARFESAIHLSERYTVREQKLLYGSARSCEVHHLLRGPIEFNHSLKLDEDEN